MSGRNWGVALVCAMILVVFAYSFWVGAQKIQRRVGRNGPPSSNSDRLTQIIRGTDFSAYRRVIMPTYRLTIVNEHFSSSSEQEFI